MIYGHVCILCLSKYCMQSKIFKFRTFNCHMYTHSFIKNTRKAYQLAPMDLRPSKASYLLAWTRSITPNNLSRNPLFSSPKSLHILHPTYIYIYTYTYKHPQPIKAFHLPLLSLLIIITQWTNKCIFITNYNNNITLNKYTKYLHNSLLAP